MVTKYLLCTGNVLFNAEHKALNTNLRHFKEYGSRRTLTGFLKINCKSEGLDTLLKNIWEIEFHNFCRHRNANRQIADTKQTRNLS